MNRLRILDTMESTRNAIEERASDWVVRHDGGLTAEEQHELEAWLAADPRHHGAYVRAKAAWYDASRWASLATRSFETRKGFNLRTSWLGWAASVVALATTLVAGTWWATSSRGKTYVSEIGEVRTIELPDGSQLVLNTDTQAVVHFEEAKRQIELNRGEALFKVAHDASRPFIVHVNDVVIRALGTAFTVRVDDARTDVVVSEGTVEVSRSDAMGVRNTQRVTANQHIVLASPASRPDIVSVTPEALGRELAWREGMAAFAGEPLSVAVAEINRHSRHRIYIDDPVLATRPVVGIFHANDAEAFAAAAAATFGAQIEHSNGDIHLQVGAQPP